MITETFTIRKKLYFTILLVFSSLIFSLLVSEFGMRFIYHEEEANGNYWGIGAFSHHNLAGYIHAPGYEGYALRSGIFKLPVKINSMGLRQEDLKQQLQYPVKLLILGDSFSFGMGVLEEHSFPSLIKKDLNALDVGIINGAQTGYSVAQERLLGVSLIEQLKPDIVILGLYAANDIKGDYFKDYLNIDVKFGYRLRRDRWLQIRPLDFLRTHSYLWMFIDSRLNSFKRQDRQAHFRTVLNTSLQEVIRPTLNAIVNLREDCESKSIVFGIVMIPPRSGKTVFDERLKAFFQEEEKIPVLDLGSIGYSNQEYLPVDGHWNEKGHEKASQFLVPFVEGLLEILQE